MELFGQVQLEARETEELVNVVVETPKGSRNKYKYDLNKGLFKLSGVLPVGASFPFDFGFIPATLAEDGDPIDVLLLMDEPAFTGCLVICRLIGAIKAEQTEEDGTTRNDRLIAVADQSLQHMEIQDLKGVSDFLMEEIEHFFESYNKVKGKKFKPLGRCSPEHAMELVEEAAKRYEREIASREGGRKAA